MLNLLSVLQTESFSLPMVMRNLSVGTAAVQLSCQSWLSFSLSAVLFGCGWLNSQVGQFSALIAQAKQLRSRTPISFRQQLFEISFRAQVRARLACCVSLQCPEKLAV